MPEFDALSFEVASRILENCVLLSCTGVINCAPLSSTRVLNCVPLSYTGVLNYLSDFVRFSSFGFLPYTLFDINTNISSCFFQFCCLGAGSLSKAVSSFICIKPLIQVFFLSLSS
jgi:hypothetical protein